MPKVVHNRLIGQNIAVNQKENPLFYSGFPQTPNDLKSGVGFAGAGGHHQKQTVFAFDDFFGSAVNRNLLEVAGRLAVNLLIIILTDYFFLPGGKSFSFHITAVKRVWRREFV